LDTVYNTEIPSSQYQSKEKQSPRTKPIDTLEKKQSHKQKKGTNKDQYETLISGFSITGFQVRLWYTRIQKVFNFESGFGRQRNQTFVC